MKKISLFVCIVLIVTAISAHEFWLQPKKFWFTINDTATISFKVGENFNGENWKGNRSKIQQLVHYSPSSIKNIHNLLSANNGDSLRLPLQEEGTHMLIFNSTNSFIELEANKFNAYLKDDGLYNTIAYRKEHNETNNKSREYYQRSVKTLLNVGLKSITNQVTKPTTLPLDIIPSKNPYTTIQFPEKISFTVLFKGKPLPNQLIKVWNTQQNKTYIKEITTDAKGTFSYKIEKAGSGIWMISTVYMEHITSDQNADWQSYWGSLTFGYGSFFVIK
jgi:uncharacterized GH25 family protein